jgi:hypothetical protein
MEIVQYRTPQKQENQTAKDLNTNTEQLSFAVLASLKTEGNCQNSSRVDHEFSYQTQAATVDMGNEILFCLR